MKEKLKECKPYIIIVIIVMILKIFIVTPIRVNGPSMEPTLRSKDIMILNKTAYYFNEPKRFEIVVVRTDENYIIKRVIGLPGEEIEYRDNTLYVNGKKVEEPVEGLETDDFTTEELGSKKIPKNSYLVLGDNRGDSYDSRSIGFVQKDQLMGRTTLTIFPIHRFGWKK